MNQAEHVPGARAVKVSPKQLHGLSVISLTPFTDTGEVDVASFRRLLDFYLAAGVHGITLLGIMGEVSKLTEADRDTVIETAVSHVAGRVPVTVGCSAPGTHQTLAFVRRAQAAGADAIMVAPPNNTRNLDLVLDHYRAVSEVSELPLVVQDEPTTTGVVLPPAFFGRVVQQVPTARYVKVEEAPTLMKVSAIREAAQDKLGLFGGLGGMYFYEELARGAVGIMTGFAFPEVLVQVYERYQAGDAEGARACFYRYLPLIRFEAQLGVTGVAIRKEIFRMRGVIASAHVRQPAPRIDERTLAELTDLVGFLGL
ncbi:dihydrodipicolinate synthase family protein [Alicyclobacillus cycloheptanicus]|uniref:4-hydroxy-tetrahydrodipicolinate synthase n=1 Tax=Alicyclobacillus cycloheptanicus TaxID=1457 RepID=A0ABT9XIX6_9BACL|nr:dihydrodipicolinate synthase family protein [Alicyclobacillus cycloheptanicus]MDQ0190255.1 4-hydroxy-tetrahydrodipicolinate synthase [Alicyclobacillus cycloheptanicus]